MVTQYLRNPNTGKFAGSIGNGKNKIPTTRHFIPRKPDTSESFYKSLTIEEKAAITGYLDQDYMKITPLLYGDQTYSTPARLNQIRLIDKILERYHSNPANHNPKTVLRTTKIMETKYTNQQELDQDLKTLYPLGTLITLKGFTSTTQNKDALFDFLPPGFADSSKKGLYAAKTQEAWNRPYDGQDTSFNNLIYAIETPNGLPVHSFGHFHANKEQEYLLPRNKQYKITKVEPYVEVEKEIPDHRQKVHATIIHLTQI